jgi:hypothetical protein
MGIIFYTDFFSRGAKKIPRKIDIGQAKSEEITQVDAEGSSSLVGR